MKFDLNEEGVTCEQCIHEKVCGKKEYLNSMVLDINKVMKYSKYNDFKIFVDCEWGVPSEPTPRTSSSTKPKKIQQGTTNEQ